MIITSGGNRDKKGINQRLKNNIEQNVLENKCDKEKGEG
jgi:hypothetical protein